MNKAPSNALTLSIIFIILVFGLQVHMYKTNHPANKFILPCTTECQLLQDHDRIVGKWDGSETIETGTLYFNKYHTIVDTLIGKYAKTRAIIGDSIPIPVLINKAFSINSGTKLVFQKLKLQEHYSKIDGNPIYVMIAKAE